MEDADCLIRARGTKESEMEQHHEPAQDAGLEIRFKAQCNI